MLHMFIQLTPDMDTRRAASEILKTKPQGDYLLLIEKLQNLENAPLKDNKKLSLNLSNLNARHVVGRVTKILLAMANVSIVRSLGIKKRTVG